MNNLEEISTLNEKIMVEIAKVNLLLEQIAYFKLENMSDAEIIAEIALKKGRNTALYGEEIERVLVQFMLKIKI